MEFRQLQAFCTVANTLSFTRAANILGYAQSSITTQIQQLEQELNAKLFERLGKSIVLTSEGECFLMYAKQILHLSMAAKEAVTGSATPKGSITIGAPESFCVHRLPLLLQEYRKRYPEVKIALKTGTCSDFAYWLRTHTIDIAFFLQQESHHPELITHTLFRDPMVIAAGADHPLIQKGTITPSDLHGETLILSENGCSYRVVLESILAATGAYPASILEFSSVSAMKQCAISGLGITLLPMIAVSTEITSSQLVNLNWVGPDFNIYAQVGYHKDKWLSPALSAFFNLAIEIFSHKTKTLA
ncbi:LysR family transcriptional regulator [Pelosinus baikalensis]|uniref:LysR family transcriptional regulator n=1 Tax=Pelosinus baikalensis TaxID=2892015 RepID=A0ABS8HS29_9FIRM|nr:LysR family transcriptional regulator [Pelosinus baikalensis]MCC5464897.1 LysR family transcriptional regulator [Pelosinus baikalensis]